MTTARDIIKAALRKIHVLGRGSSLSSEEAVDALETLNDMLSSFSTTDAMVFQETKETFTLTGSQVSYTIGSGLDFNTTAPLEISAAYVTQGSTNYLVTAYDEKEYSRISQPSTTGSVPQIYYYDNNYPTANIYFYPAPASSTTFTWFSRKPLTAFTDLNTTFAMPEQYQAMLKFNLAVWLAPEYEREASAEVRRIALSTKNAVIKQNEKNENNISFLIGIPIGGVSQRGNQNILSGY